jgi:hypothetical protein
MSIRVKNWKDFQHYKDRSPPWIKLHKGLLDNYEYQCLPVASRALAPMIWLLASESDDGSIDPDPKKIAFRLRMTEKEVIEALKPLIDAGFVIVDSDVLADCKQHAMPETETETETEERKKAAAPRFDPLAMALPAQVKPAVWERWIKYRRARRLTTSEQTLQAQLDRLAEWASHGQDPGAVIDQSIEKGWQGLFGLKSNEPQTSERQRRNDLVAVSLGHRKPENPVIEGIFRADTTLAAG